MAVDMKNIRLTTAQNSALWAAYGDALGFITELADKRILKARADVSYVATTIPWNRRIGGRFGPTVPMPEGCYSDDTQLRLSTCRAILGTGHFDVEIFAKVELPVWPTYALGAGTGSKVAATQLARLGFNWFSNFFKQKHTEYINGGGNGAAMRIQPHVWASRDVSDPSSYIPDVIRNAVCTHGHPRGILGAVFHALCLAHAYQYNEAPGPEVWRRSADYFSLIPDIMKSDADLDAFWVTTWESKTKKSIAKAIEEVKWECTKDIDIICSLQLDADNSSYKELVESIGALSPSSRGSGIKTALIASVLTWLFRNNDPDDTVIMAANLLSSDTDTIGTMAGAIVGCITEKPPEGRILDSDYIKSEATRLFNISQGAREKSFGYPDIQDWKPPKNQLEGIGEIDGRLTLSGIASGDTISEEHIGQKKDSFVWQWINLDIGQTVLTKRRKNVPQLPISNYPVKTIPAPTETKKHQANPETSSKRSIDMFSQKTHYDSEASLKSINSLDVDTLTREAIASGFDANIIGHHLIQLSKLKNGVNLSVAYSAIISKAISTRERYGKQ